MSPEGAKEAGVGGARLCTPPTPDPSPPQAGGGESAQTRTRRLFGCLALCIPLAIVLISPAHAQIPDVPNAHVVVPELGGTIGEFIADMLATFEAHVANRSPPERSRFARLTAEQLAATLPNRRWYVSGMHMNGWMQFEPDGVLRTLIDYRGDPGQETASSWVMRGQDLCLSWAPGSPPGLCLDAYGYGSVLLLGEQEARTRMLVYLLMDERIGSAIRDATQGPGAETPQ